MVMGRGGFPNSFSGGGGNKSNNLIEQAKKMKKDMEKAQAEIDAITVEASVGGGAVTVVASGSKEIKAITIKPEVVDPEDVEMLQDLVLSAVNEALRKAGEIADDEMNKITGGMGGGFPGL
jgi:DNA-binding YbaB/EbfC family protein